MAEVGLLPFARIALPVWRAMLPCYRSRFSIQPTAVVGGSLLYHFLRRLDDQSFGRTMGDNAHRLSGSQRHGRMQVRKAVDAAGLSQGAGSTFFVKLMHYHGQIPLPWWHWLEWVVVADLDLQFQLLQIARRGPSNRPVLE